MATLNTLRTRGGIVVSIVIGIALLAFLLGDFGNQGASAFQERKMRVGEIDGEKIGYTQFTDKVDYLTAIVETSSGRNSLSAEEQDQIRDQAWDFLVSQYALEPGFEAAGFRVGEAEQIDMVDGTCTTRRLSAARSSIPTRASMTAPCCASSCRTPRGTHPATRP